MITINSRPLSSMKTSTPSLQVGNKVSITKGRLKGKEGVVQQVGDDKAILTRDYVRVRIGSAYHWMLPYQLEALTTNTL